MNTSWLKAPLRWINRHPLWHAGRTAVWGSRLRAPTFDRWLALRLHRAGLMGVADRRFLEKEVRPGMTVVDIGANQGLYALLFARLTGENGRVLAFEPDALLHGALAENAAFNGARHVRTYPLALGSKQDTLTLYRSLLNSGDNRLARGAAADGPREEIRVQIVRLDEVLAGERIDFIKMDVQGWEMEAFRGMQGLLDAPANAALAIYFEFWPQGLRDAGSEPSEPLDFLRRHGFTIYPMQGQRIGPPISDVEQYVGSVPRRSYVNLYARRAL